MGAWPTFSGEEDICRVATARVRREGGAASGIESPGANSPETNDTSGRTCNYHVTGRTTNVGSTATLSGRTTAFRCRGATTGTNFMTAEAPGHLQRLVRRAFDSGRLLPLSATNEGGLHLPHCHGPVAGAELEHQPGGARIRRHALAATPALGP